MRNLICNSYDRYQDSANLIRRIVLEAVAASAEQLKILDEKLGETNKKLDQLTSIDQSLKQVVGLLQTIARGISLCITL